MHTVILRDDDTNALTPPECLERLYRPFLDRGLPVNLAVIPEVRTSVLRPDGRREGFISAAVERAEPAVPLSENRRLVAYLRSNPGYHIAQHGCHHDTFEFDIGYRSEIARRLDLGGRRLREAGFAPPQTFVAPYDRFSPEGLGEVVRRFGVVSTGWFEWRRIPPRWWPRYLWYRARGRHHWRVGRTLLLRHPGCLLSCDRPYSAMLASVQSTVASRPLTVLVTHWWEYFREGRPDEAFISILHACADWLAESPNIEVLAFDELRGARPNESSL
jgi:hypothetical protein